MNYEAIATKDGSWWLIEIPALGCVGQAARRSQIHDVSRDLAAVWLDVPEEEISITVKIALPGQIRQEWADVEVLESSARADLECAAKKRRKLIETALETYSKADLAAAIGISKQRLSQLSK